jgi:hypothetical protein
MALYVMVMDTWRKMLEGDSVIIAIAFSVIVWSPLLMILFLDAMKRQSRLFRIAMPSAYLLYVLTSYINYGYIYQPTPIIQPDTNSTGSAQHAASALGTFESQISGSLSSIGLLMLTCLRSAASDKTGGGSINFPMKIAKVMKDTVALILKGKGKMMTQVDEESQRVVLVPRHSSPDAPESHTEEAGAHSLTAEAEMSTRLPTTSVVRVQA